MTLDDFSRVCAAIVGFGAVVVLITRFVHGALDQFDDRVATQLVPLKTAIEEIHHEVTTNNGSSLKDAVRRLEGSVAEAAELARHVAADLADSHARADAVEGAAGAAADAASRTEQPQETS